MKNNADYRSPYAPVEEGLPLFKGVRTSSAEAFSEIKASGTLGSQARAILKLLTSSNGATMSLQEIARETGIAINAVSGRVNELKNTNPRLIGEGAKRKCKITGRTIIPVGVDL